MQAMWTRNRGLPPGSNAEIDRGIAEIMSEFDLTFPEWHHWACAVSYRVSPC